MSGDVQPRKRKDKKKKKDDLGVEEPRGTAAVFGEGDVFMHSYSDHGTGGHWCAKVIFFSLLAVLITLIGLIILENRGLSELEANSVETRYSGVLEGWIEDAPDDDHHDEHTLELKHHDEEEDHGSELGLDDHDDEDDDEDDADDHDDEDDEHDDEHENDEDENDDEQEQEDDEDAEQSEDSIEDKHEDDDDGNDDDNDGNDDDNADYLESEENLETTEQDQDDIEEAFYKKQSEYSEQIDNDDDDDDDDDDVQENESDEQNDDEDPQYDNDNEDKQQDNDDDEENYIDEKENDDIEDKTLEHVDDGDSEEADDFLEDDATPDNEDEDEHEEEEAANVEIEAIEKEVSDDDPVSTEEPADEENDDDESQEVSEELAPDEDNTSVEDDDVEFLEPDELDELPIVEPITAPKGKPLPELEESPSTEKPQDTLAEEEEYERRQEALRKEKEQASQGMLLKLTVGCALLVATHAVLRRATASRAEPEDELDHSREETPLSDRRMTIISDPVPPSTVAPKTVPESRPIQAEFKKEEPIIQSPPPSKEVDEEENEEIIVTKFQPSPSPKDEIDKELYSDEEEIEEEEEAEVVEQEQEVPQKAVPQTTPAKVAIPDVTKEVTPEPDEDDDVEIIDEEQLEEELEEEEISDVDDAELLSRLEEKYGRLPEPDRPGRTQKDGGNSIEDEWPGESSDAFWSEHLEQAQRELREGEWTAAAEKASAPALRTSGRARYIVARALDSLAEAKKDNQLLNKAIAAYMELLKMNERLSDGKLLEVADRALDRIKFRGTYLSAEPVYKLLIRRFPNEPHHRNNLTVSFLMANRADLAENVLKETLKLWPNDRIALAHHGFILKTLHNRLEEAVKAFTKALEGDAGPANEPRFYYHLGDALLLLGRFAEAHEVHKRGAALGHFLSPAQRSLYNVNRLKSKPWWDVNQTSYARLAQALEKSWKDILREAEAAKALYEKEKEGLKERGDWSQLDLFVRGREVPDRCSRAPITCKIVKAEAAASGCRRGQIKFSAMEPGTHVRPHVGPTNCRLRMHLGLSNTKDTYIRVDKEIRQWQLGKVLMFDDSFEHEVWHNGTGARLVLIVDVWHPDLTPAERRQLPAI